MPVDIHSWLAEAQARFQSVFVLRAKCWLETGAFYRRTDKLRAALPEGERAVPDGGAGPGGGPPDGVGFYGAKLLLGH